MPETPEEFKVQGNQAFSGGHILSAMAFYSKAIETAMADERMASWRSEAEAREALEEAEELQEGKETDGPVEEDRKVSPPYPLHIYLSNRSFCHIKLENFGAAAQDATDALSYDAEYSKAYYRRGCARFLLQKYEDALEDFRTVAGMTRDPGAVTKMRSCRDALRAKRFSAAISSEQGEKPSEKIDWAKLGTDPEGYTGPDFFSLATLTSREAKKELIEKTITYLKDTSNRIPRRHVYRLISDAIELLRLSPTLVDVDVGPDSHITVCGDVHGQFYDLANIFSINGLPGDDNPYLFNGDFVDRGAFSVECIITLLLSRVLFGGSFHLARGNHETYEMNTIHGFRGELIDKYEDKLHALFCECFRLLPVAHVLRKEVFVTHGGLFSRDGVTLEEIRNLDRDVEPGESGLLTEMLWSDPIPQKGRAPSKRGVACMFGPDVTKDFLDTNGLRMVVRSHEMKDQGYEVEHDGQLATVFSAPNYCDQMGNQAAFAKFVGSETPMIPHFTQFQAVEHPAVKSNQFSPLYQMMQM